MPHMQTTLPGQEGQDKGLKHLVGTTFKTRIRRPYFPTDEAAPWKPSGGAIHLVVHIFRWKG